MNVDIRKERRTGMLFLPSSVVLSKHNDISHQCGVNVNILEVDDKLEVCLLKRGKEIGRQENKG